MGAERTTIQSSATLSSAKFRNEVLTEGTRNERPVPLAAPSPSGSTPSPDITEGINRHTSIPTIEVSDPGDNGSLRASSWDNHSASPRFELLPRTPSPKCHPREGSPGSKLASLKKKSYHVLSLGLDKVADKGKAHEDGLLRAPLTGLAGSSGSPIWKRRAASMPAPDLQKQARMDILHHTDPVAARSYLASGSPPIVDFTRFEDRYRSPSSDYDALVSVSKNDNERKAMSHLLLSRGEEKNKPGRVSFNGSPESLARCGHTESLGGTFGGTQPGGFAEMARNSSGRNVVYPANERKPDPRLIVDALENASERNNIRKLLDWDDLLKIHEVDQQNFELRNSETNRQSRAEKARTVFGESIQNVFRYGSTAVILGEREYILPIVVVHCIEEVYRTGIYQPNLFRTLPNRPRLHELISIFDSEEQPPGSVIRSRQSSSTLEGFGAATSLHLESTPDICALLASYLSALPEPILLPNLFEIIWKLCDVDEQSHTYFPALPSDSSAPLRLSSIPLARSYTSQSEATYILIAQLLLQLLPSPHFFLFVYLLSFFSQVVLVREENGVGIEDVSKMFGTRIFGHGYGDESILASHPQSSSRSIKAKGSDKERSGRGEAMMVWFLRRWGPLSETLFEVANDATIRVLHRNKRLRKDSLGKAAKTSGHTTSHEALRAVESELRDEQEDGEVESLVRREFLGDGDVTGSVDLSDPANSVGCPPTIHLPMAMDLKKPAMSTSFALQRKGLDFLSLPQDNSLSSGIVPGAGLMTEGSRQSSSASSGSSSSTLPLYTAGSSPNGQTIKLDFDITVPRRLQPDALRSQQQEMREALLSGDDDLCHSTPKRSFADGTLDPRTGDADHPDEGSPLSREIVTREEGNVDQSVEDGESTHSLPSLHERLLDVSMPISIFDFDETMPVTVNVDNNSPSLLTATSAVLPLTPKRGHEPRSVKIPERSLTPRISSTSRIPSNTELKRQVPALPNSSSAFSLGPDRRRLMASSTVNTAFLSPSPAPLAPAKSSGHLRTRSEPKLPISRSTGFQQRSRVPGVSIPAGAARKGEGDDKDAVITALKERLVEVERERDDARKVVTEVKKAIGIFDDGLLHTLHS